MTAKDVNFRSSITPNRNEFAICRVVRHGNVNRHSKSLYHVYCDLSNNGALLYSSATYIRCRAVQRDKSQAHY